MAFCPVTAYIGVCVDNPVGGGGGKCYLVDSDDQDDSSDHPEHVHGQRHVQDDTNDVLPGLRGVPICE